MCSNDHICYYNLHDYTFTNMVHFFQFNNMYGLEFVKTFQFYELLIAKLMESLVA